MSKGITAPCSILAASDMCVDECAQPMPHTRVLKTATDMRYSGITLEDLGRWEKIIFTSIIFLYGM